MKRFIFRNPFVTKRDIRLAKGYLELADAYAAGAESSRKHGDTESATQLELSAIKMWNLAAKAVGFRNVLDMTEYIDRHGHL